MSSSSEDESSQQSSVKTSKRPRACDNCRKKRGSSLRWPSPVFFAMLDLYLARFRLHLTGLQRRVPSKKYIASLENRLEELNRALRQLCPDESFYDTWVNVLSEEPDPPPPPTMQFPPLSLFRSTPSEGIARSIRASLRYSPANTPHSDDEEPTDIIAAGLDTKRFFGKSSGEMLVREALAMKKSYEANGSESDTEQPIFSHRREEFWSFRTWERKVVMPSLYRYVFPDPDLAKELISLYFKHVNVDIPLLHRPSFERSARDGLYYTDEGFADIYLLVCALGARFSSDPRVRLDDVVSHHSAGWRWFNQLDSWKESYVSMPSLYGIQSYCLSILFIQFSTAPQCVWLLIGVAIRLIQDVGTHRHKSTIPSMQDELWKRAFWVLVYMDRIVSIGFGRPLTILDEDFDADLPIECDDEYWEHPDPRKRFKQPPNKPSLVTAFLQQLKLMKILSTCNRLIMLQYPLDKLRTHLGLDGEESKSNIVAELDSSLNEWLRALPEHLRWDPENSNKKFILQSASIYVMYYHTQIFIHRPFVRSSVQPTTSSSPSLAICNTAARASIRIAEVQLDHGVPPRSPMQFTVFTSAIMLLIGIWDREKTSGPGSLSVEPHPDMEFVRKSLQILESAEDTWPQAGKFRDLLSVLLSMRGHSDRRHTSDNSEDKLFGGSVITEPTAPAGTIPNVASPPEYLLDFSVPEQLSLDLSSFFNIPPELNAGHFSSIAVSPAKINARNREHYSPSEVGTQHQEGTDLFMSSGKTIDASSNTTINPGFGPDDWQAYVANSFREER
ncbi:hypothetical protein NLJ89_g9078 [Agrocybe chaxingu]|uniref:Xylanolytic transcriptional activator regulatory domain-containing protein n=1 Tax=Agrocybe chaxingu TaxID=84603 RepID=A0A9W8JRG3_9AGAR|nr:hypothetical protein NLJ89_g9078 [Agrocybe chaxingu]